MKPVLRSLYEQTVLGHPALSLLVTLLVLGAILTGARDFKLDASSDSLVLENDQALRYYRLIKARYGSDDFLVISYSPQQDLFSEPALDAIRGLRDELLKLPRVASVTSLLDVPLFLSPPISLFAMGRDYRTLQMKGVDHSLARHELTSSPLYRDRLLSSDGRTTAIQVNLIDDPAHSELLRQRDALRAEKYRSGLSADSQLQLYALSERIHSENSRILAMQEENVAAVRALVERYRQDGGQWFVGGIPMIVVDMIHFISNDLLRFGLAVILCMALTMGLIFRQWRWVLLPTGLSLLTGLIMVGLLGMLDWRVTVISSNFFSLLLIMTLSIVIHLVVRYRELQVSEAGAARRTLTALTMRSMAQPCLFTSLTTVVAFGSLIVSGIRPVIDFGWMMAIGVMLGLILSFIIFPAVICLLPATAAPTILQRPPLSSYFARLTEQHGGSILLLATGVFALALAGLPRLGVENRFIDYFKPSTEIHRGMNHIDAHLGGTMPLDVIIDGIGRDYWDNPELRARVTQIHDFLDALPQTGKVLSVDTFMRTFETINSGIPLDNFYLKLLSRKMPAEVRAQVIDPYLSDQHDQLRFTLRVRESTPGLDRQQLIDTIQDHLIRDMGFEKSHVHITGMMVLYNNMLQSLFRSQILTIGAVLLAVMLMFVAAFRSLSLALLGIIPNLLPSAVILGVMGWAGIPLDMMTITIAAIAIGIGVDDTIHYIHRFTREFHRDHDYLAAMHRSHRSIGRAMLYTSVIITVGFSVLALSNFIPTIYFGLFTGFAMLAALLANLTLLPRLLMVFKPFGPATDSSPARHAVN